MILQEEIDELKKNIAAASDKSERGNLLIKLLNKYLFTGSKDVTAYIEELRTLGAETSDLKLNGWADVHEGLVKRNKADYDAALRLLDLAQTRFTEINDVNGSATARMYAGYIHFDLGNYSEALKCQKEAIKQLEKTNYHKLLANAWYEIGRIHYRLANYPEAMKNNVKALQMRREFGEEYGIVISLMVIGNLYFEQLNYPEALEHFMEGKKLAEKLGDLHNGAAFTASLGLLYQAEKKYEEALECFRQGLKHFLQLEDQPNIANSYMGIGEAYLELGKPDEAMKYFILALEIYERLNDPYGSANAMSKIGAVLNKTQKPEEGAGWLQKSNAIAEKLSAKDLLASNYLQLCEADELTGAYKDALKNYKLHHEYEKKILGAKAQEQLTRLNFKHDTERKEEVHKATEKILHNILPAAIAEKIKNGEEKIIQRFESATVLFADMVGFTAWSKEKDVNELADALDTLFNHFDELALKYGVEKIKTIGDSYMCAAGLPEPCDDHALRAGKMALAMNEKIKEAYPNGEIKLRIGIHTGEVIAGVLGKNKYAYDLWGDTVNTASRMESHGAPEKIQVSEEFRRAAAAEAGGTRTNAEFAFEERGEIEIKGKGKMRTWFLLS